MNKKKKEQGKYNKRGFLVVFCVGMILIATVRHVFSIEVPDIMAGKHRAMAMQDSLSSALSEAKKQECVFLDDDAENYGADGTELEDDPADEVSEATDSVQVDCIIDAGVGRNKIIGVYSFDKCFPDINDVQLEAARANGITPVHTREEAQQLVRMNKLVNISNSPFYTVDDLYFKRHQNVHFLNL